MRITTIIGSSLAVMLGGMASAQMIEIKVQEKGGRPVPSIVKFKPASAPDWKMLDRTEPNGRLRASLACSPGTLIKATPGGDYWDSQEEACRAVVPALIVTPRSRAILAAVAALEGSRIDREKVADALATVMLSRATPSAEMSDEELELQAYLYDRKSLSPQRAAQLQTELLNQVSSLFARTDRDRNGILVAAEVDAAIRQAPEG